VSSPEQQAQTCGYTALRWHGPGPFFSACYGFLSVFLVSKNVLVLKNVEIRIFLIFENAQIQKLFKYDKHSDLKIVQVFFTKVYISNSVEIQKLIKMFRLKKYSVKKIQTLKKD
jgi:hypothetical protein